MLERYTRSGTCQPEQCGSACCKFVALFQQRMLPAERAFYEARGIPIVAYPTGDEALHIAHRCQHLTELGACAVYGTPERPAACEAYPTHPFDLVGVERCSYTFTKA
jgi:hypothetical protein